MNKTKDFSQILQDIGIPETRIPLIISALNDLHFSLCQLDSSSMMKLQTKFTSLDDLFEVSQTGKKIAFKKRNNSNVFTPKERQ